MIRPTIGILAGMGPRSTAPFLTLVLNECEFQYGAVNDIDYPKMMICSLPVPFYPDRAIDHDAMKAALRVGLRELVNAGAAFLAIPCNTAHVYFAELRASVQVPLLNMVDLTLDAVGGARRAVAVVAARPTMESEIYQRGLERRGHKVVDVSWQDDVDHLIGATRKAHRDEMIPGLWSQLVARAQAHGANTLLVGCMDLSAVLGLLRTELSVVDAGTCLARAIVGHWRSWPVDAR
jgi:aspartate racemase